MITMEDVARRAGVSVMTVSNVVNSHPHVREATRQRVLAAIDELGYRVNTTARSLRQGRTGVIGLAVPEIDRPYFGHLAELLIARAAEDGYDIVIEQTGAARAGELAALAHSRLRSYDGLILSAVTLSGADATFVRSDFPVVLLGERSYSQAVDHVLMANVAGAALAAEHLLERGSRRLAMLGGTVGDGDGVEDIARLRARGFLAAAERADSVVDSRLVLDCEYSLAGGHAAALRLLDSGIPFDGLFCATDTIAFGALRALSDHRIAVPGQVRVIGFDDVPLAAYVAPSLTSVSPDLVGMVNAAVSLIVGRIDGTRPAAIYQEYEGSIHLEERESTL